MLTAGLSKHARRGCLEKLNNSMTGHILERARARPRARAHESAARIAHGTESARIHMYVDGAGDVREKGALAE